MAQSNCISSRPLGSLKSCRMSHLRHNVLTLSEEVVTSRSDQYVLGKREHKCVFVLRGVGGGVEWGHLVDKDEQVSSQGD